MVLRTPGDVQHWITSVPGLREPAQDMSADRFFLAAMLPEESAAEVIRFQPEATPLVRCTPTDQLHLTLHYIGAGDEYQLGEAFSGFIAPAVPLVIDGVGRFGGGDQATTLWAGVHLDESLRDLHTQVASALAVTGFRPESRPYHPHISLARCRQGVGCHVVEAFIRNGADLHLVTELRTLGLFVSSFIHGVPTYRLVLSTGLDT